MRDAMVLSDNMILKRRYKLGRIIPADRHQGVRYNAHLDAEAGRMVATNGHCMAIVPVEPHEPDATGRIPANALTTHMSRGVIAGEVSMVANGSLVVQDNGKRVEYSRAVGSELDIPAHWADLVPTPAPDDFIVALDASLLARLAEAIGAGDPKDPKSTNGFPSHYVRLRIPREGDRIRVETLHGDSAVGIIMNVLLV